MKKYRCKKSFVVDEYDADGFLIENSQTIIEEGSSYELGENGTTIIGGEVHLDSIEDSCSWLEITKETLEEYFEEVKDK